MTIAVTQPVNLDSAPVPRNPAERLVFRQMYETLVRLDCEGRLRPALAERWSRDATGTVWSFELRRDLPLGVSGMLDASAVQQSWQRRRNGGIWPWPAILEVAVESALRIRVRLDVPHHQLPTAFADPALAVTGPRLEDRPPAESGAFRYLSSMRPSTGPVLQQFNLVPMGPHPHRPAMLIEVLHPGTDPRDMLYAPAGPSAGGQPADALVTRDPATLAYARGHGEFRTIPLTWDLTYVLVTPSAAATGDDGDGEFRESLARDVVRADARGAEPPFWWKTSAVCHGTMPLLPMGRAQEITYPKSDMTARELAERVVALSGSTAREHQWLKALLGRGSGGPSLRATGLDPEALVASLGGGNAAGYVVPLPRPEPANCLDLPRWPSGSAVIALVDSRAHAIVRKGAPPFLIDGDGTIRFITVPGPQ